MAQRFRLTRDDGRSWTFDGVIRVAVSPANRVTEHPVESGGAVADHIQRLPQNITISGIVTETPLAWQALLNSSGGSGASNISNFLAFLEAGRFGTWILTGPRLGTVTDLALTRWPHDFTVRADIRPTIGLKQIRIAEAGSTYISVSDPVSTTDADGNEQDYASEFADEVDTGEQPTKQLDKDDGYAEKNTSDLHDLVTYLGG